MKNIFLTPRKERAFHQKAIALFLAISMNLSVGGLGVLLLPSAVYAATVSFFSDSFGSSVTNTVTGWAETESNGQDARIETASDRFGSPTKGHIRLRADASVTRTVSTLGYTNIILKYYWRGDSQAESSDRLKVYWRDLPSGSFQEVGNHQLNQSTTTWSSQVSVALPSGANDTSIELKLLGASNSSSEEARLDDIELIGTEMENTLARCTDQIDNDDDAQTDLADSDCAQFKPTLTVVKNVVGGTQAAENFILHVNNGDGFPGNTNGTMFTYAEPIQYSVTEDIAADYNATFSADCSGTVAINEHKTCTVTNSYDLCANIEGNQSEVPSGTVRNGVNCVPIPPPQSCETEMITLNLVSGTATHVGNVTGPTAAPLSFIHSAWTASIPFAIWIWATDPVADPVNQTTESFFDVFDLVHPLASDPILSVATDNTYKVFVNDVLIHEDANENNFQSGTQDSFAVPAANFRAGSNTIKFEVTNLALSNGTPQSNPAGLLYKLSTQTNSCDLPSQGPVAHVIATKIVCDNESDLPNWGSGGDPIDENTVANFLEEKGGSCHVASEWSFQYAGQNSENPGDELVGEAEGFTTFGATDENGEAITDIPLIDNGEDGYQDIHLREVLKSGFIPFGMGTGNGDNSAEFYCANDVQNYDNFDYITNPKNSGTYYCVAFNATKKVVDQTASLTVIKHVVNDNSGNKQASEFTLHVNIPETPQEYTLGGIFGIKTAFANIEQLFAPASFSGDEEGTVVYFHGGTDYNVTEDQDAGYTTSMSGDCTGHIALGEHKTCTVTNDDIAPTPPSGGGGSSTYDHWGCTNPTASNFNPLSNRDDGSCQLPPPPTEVGSGEPQGEVLGAATTTEELRASCTNEYLRDYLKLGIKNDPEQVKLLQVFLNETIDAKLPVTGFFGNLTKNWVKKFQKQYHREIIQPWLDAGYKGSDINEGTGYVYKTTKRYINLMKCADLNIPLPDLTPDLR